MGRNLRLLTILLTLGPALVPASAWADATFVVNSIGDLPDADTGDGNCLTITNRCTLRAAIQQANATPGLDHINFAIGTGTQTITIFTTALPAITDAVVIDGTTQPGFAGAPIVVVKPAATLTGVDGLVITAGGSTVRGLVVNGFSGNGIKLSSLGGNLVAGNYIGTDAAGTAAAGNGGSGVLIDGSPTNVIGGTTAAARNVISGNAGSGDGGGILISGSGATGNVVEGNFIGTNATGTAALGNATRGVAIKDAPGNVIGVTGSGNLISGNAGVAVRILGASATGNLVQANLIGTDATVKVALSNGEGVQIRSDDNTVKGNIIVASTLDGVAFLESPNGNLVQGNLIWANGGNGIGLYDDGVRNRFSGNSIYLNASNGIDLAPTGPTPNDPGDADTGPNNLQNYATVTAAQVSGTGIIVSGMLENEPDGTYTVELFASQNCDGSGFGQGEIPIGTAPLAMAGGGTALFSIRLASTVPAGYVVTATATDQDGNTSEFSPCEPVAP